MPLSFKTLKIKIMKLTKNQKEVVRLMRDGIDFYYNPVTNYRPFTVGHYGMTAEMVHGRIMNKLEKMGVLSKQKHNQIIYKYSLTETGKTIEI